MSAQEMPIGTKDPEFLPPESYQHQGGCAAEEEKKKAKVLLGEFFSFSQISSLSVLRHFHKI